MRALSVLSACVVLTLASHAHADSRQFIIANQPDGYGIDQCLANGDKCGFSAARAYCQSRDFAQAVTFRRVEPEDVTGAVPVSASSSVGGEYVAITCER